MRNNYCTTWVTKNGGHSYGAGRPHFLGEEGERGRAAVRRCLGFAKELGLRIQNSSPTKRDILAVAVLVRSEG